MRVHLVGTDLLIQTKLAGMVRRAGGTLSRDPAACDVAVVRAEVPGALEPIWAFVAAGIPVLAFAPHVRADLLRAAREAGAIAVPNSEIEHCLGVVLTSPSLPPQPGSGEDEPSPPSEA
jgi:hypothetical protein